MVTNSKINKIKNFSVSKAMLASLRKLKEASREDVLSHEYVRNLCSQKNKNTYRSSIFRLHKNGFIKKEYNNILVLTDKGREESLFSFIDAETSLFKNDSQKWDGGWRIVFFDVPESKRKYRDYLRKILRQIGFKEFQKSIWAYPYPVPPFLKELIFDKNISNCVKFITANNVYDDSGLKRIFNLKSKE